MTNIPSSPPAAATDAATQSSVPSRRSLLRATAAVGAAAGLSVVSKAGSARADEHAPTSAPHHRPSAATIVTAHGAFAESSSWDDVVSILQRHGHGVVSVAVPLRGVAFDATYFSDVVRTLPGPLVLVGHSYGGVVISSTPAAAGDIRGLVYVSGLAGDTGETSADLVGKYPGSTLGPTLTSVELTTGGHDLYIDQAKYHEQFCADLSNRKAAQMATSQRPILESAFTEPFGPHPLWKSVPSRFLWGELDRNIPRRAHQFMSRRAGAIEAIEVPGASHVVGISHPRLTAALIERAARAAARTR
ncbi:alpha/beta fold hydrolase [Terrabacter sp. Soil811]|uniref:alpha/beta fold hydrolase n=1 Tax=Terrabacter sp. Soil811 TaxID=1736419 RepID=UPI0009E6F1B5|nr:alpha/beta hydrolase [Terrabacter sp. Soil811]